MILFMNLKNGVGCTTLTYNLGRLFNQNIFVKKDSFMLDEYYAELFPSVYEVNSDIKDGFYDVGSDVKSDDTSKLIKKANAIVLPMDFGHETYLKSIETIKHIRNIRADIPVIIVVNRLDVQDAKRDFTYQHHLADQLADADIGLASDFKYKTNPEEDMSIMVTYLRNSYGLFCDFEYGKYFLDRFLTDQSPIENSEHYKFFLYLTYRMFTNKNYANKNEYRQDKDMVIFRLDFLDKCENLDEFKQAVEKYKNFRLNTNKEYKLIKDISYIAHYISKYI